MSVIAARLGGRLFYGWLVVAVAGLVILASGGTRSAAGALYRDRGRHGWSRADIALAGAAGPLFLGLGGPLSGVLIDRYGVRRVTVLALALCRRDGAGGRRDRARCWCCCSGS